MSQSLQESVIDVSKATRSICHPCDADSLSEPAPSRDGWGGSCRHYGESLLVGTAVVYRAFVKTGSRLSTEFSCTLNERWDLGKYPGRRHCQR